MLLHPLPDRSSIGVWMGGKERRCFPGVGLGGRCTFGVAFWDGLRSRADQAAEGHLGLQRSCSSPQERRAPTAHRDESNKSFNQPCRSNARSKVNFTKSGNGPALKFISCQLEPRNLTIRPPKCVLFRLPWASSPSPYTPPLLHVHLEPALPRFSLRDAPPSTNPTIQHSAVPRSRTTPCAHKRVAQRRPCA